MPRRVRMVVLCSRPNYELRAFQARAPGPPAARQWAALAQVAGCVRARRVG